MIIEIDQSGKIEYTSHKSIVGDSLGNYVCIPAKNKRTLQQIYRSINKPRMYVLQIFSVMIAYVIQFSYHRSHFYVIDTEYPGKESEIKSNVMESLQRIGILILSNQISFGRIGKKSKAHTTVYNAFTSSKNSGKILSVKQALIGSI